MMRHKDRDAHRELAESRKRLLNRRRSTDRDPRRLAYAAVIVAVLVALWWTTL